MPPQNPGAKYTSASTQRSIFPKRLHTEETNNQTQQGTGAKMSEDQVANAVETAAEDENVIPNGKGHEPSEGTAATSPAGNEEKWVFSDLPPSVLM